MSVPCTFNFFESLSPVDLKALNPFENRSKVWKSVSKYISEQLTRTFAVLVRLGLDLGPVGIKTPNFK